MKRSILLIHYQGDLITWPVNKCHCDRQKAAQIKWLLGKHHITTKDNQQLNEHCKSACMLLPLFNLWKMHKLMYFSILSGFIMAFNNVSSFLKCKHLDDIFIYILKKLYLKKILRIYNKNWCFVVKSKNLIFNNNISGKYV